MASVNKVIIVGNLGKDPEVRRFPNGGQVCNLTVATSENWRDKSTGERKERTEWHRVAIFNEGLCRIAEQYLKKGLKVYLEGQLQTRKYEKNGQDHYATEIVLQGFNSTLTMLDGKSGDDKPERLAERQPDDRQEPQGGGGFIDDEIPFAPEWR